MTLTATTTMLAGSGRHTHSAAPFGTFGKSFKYQTHKNGIVNYVETGVWRSFCVCVCVCVLMFCFRFSSFVQSFASIIFLLYSFFIYNKPSAHFVPTLARTHLFAFTSRSPFTLNWFDCVVIMTATSQASPTVGENAGNRQAARVCMWDCVDLCVVCQLFRRCDLCKSAPQLYDAVTGGQKLRRYSHSQRARRSVHSTLDNGDGTMVRQMHEC